MPGSSPGMGSLGGRNFAYITVFNGASEYLCQLQSKSHLNSAVKTIILPQRQEVTLGAHDILNQERTWQVIPVKEAICHPDYIPSEYFNDIMILKLERKAMRTAAVWPLILPRGTAQVRPGEVCRVAGWRLIGPNGIISNTLREVELTVQQEQGDTGSPLICANMIQGIALGGRIDGTPPRVFIKLSRFLPWIKETMKCYEMPLSIGTSPPSLELIQNVTSN
ncbi:granzyme B(G,H)-like [Equus caballus]|uniref:granzyme B(G,H)-like n=1 Tax=Equus caballus TaxID=9796 RepID=UPI0038B27445